MKYYEVKFKISPSSDVASDVLSALLADVGFEAFEPLTDGLLAWIRQGLYAEEGVESVLESFPLPEVSITYTLSEAPDENWNQVWEQEGFRPIIITGEQDSSLPSSQPLIVIHDTNHTDVPQAEYDIKINPCQAFGTGSHETTRMILSQLVGMPMQGRHVVDAGTGTGILTIMCRMLGASRVLAYDIDEWSVRNAQDNLMLNNVQDGVRVLLGDSSVLRGGETECSEVGETECSEVGEDSVFTPTLLIANINRNILLADMQRFASCLDDSGELLLSGFYTEDVPVLITEASRYGFKLIQERVDGNWALLLLKKG